MLVCPKGTAGAVVTPISLPVAKGSAFGLKPVFPNENWFVVVGGNVDAWAVPNAGVELVANEPKIFFGAAPTSLVVPGTILEEPLGNVDMLGVAAENPKTGLFAVVANGDCTILPPNGVPVVAGAKRAFAVSNNDCCDGFVVPKPLSVFAKPKFIALPVCFGTVKGVTAVVAGVVENNGGAAVDVIVVLNDGLVLFVIKPNVDNVLV